jgi:hypothetical protein
MNREARVNYIKTERAQQRGFSPTVISEGGRIVWLAGQTGVTNDQGKSLAGNFEGQAAKFSRHSMPRCKRRGASQWHIAVPARCRQRTLNSPPFGIDQRVARGAWERFSNRAVSPYFAWGCFAKSTSRVPPHQRSSKRLSARYPKQTNHIPDR